MQTARGSREAPFLDDMVKHTEQVQIQSHFNLRLWICEKYVFDLYNISI